ncbi:HU family DNA-binding protein [Zoogloea sp.]|jgi:DNA-binding protein HU-beta|uniref:HU family DNA-binding protein n=1 Tax=Zoogloea sp. TaxID=49181 RepID=UPI0035ADC9D7
MNKSDLVDQISAETQLSKVATAKVIDAMIVAVRDALQRGDSVTLVGFGTFHVGERSARNGRNPRTGKAIKIDSAKIPKFRAGKALKSAL